jgi:hypothetical protein
MSGLVIIAVVLLFGAGCFLLGTRVTIVVVFWVTCFGLIAAALWPWRSS